MKYGLMAVLFLTSCAHVSETVHVTCVVNNGPEARFNKEAKKPLVLHEGSLIFFDEDGKMFKLEHKSCGIN